MSNFFKPHKQIMDSHTIEKLIPARFKDSCSIGICNPLYLETGRPAYCDIPKKFGGPTWSVRPSEILPGIKSIIAVINYTPVAIDYSVEGIALLLADILWKKLRIKTHLLDEEKRPDQNRIIGRAYGEHFVNSSSPSGRKKIILLKEIAYYAGLGQYGKNSLIINKRFGSDIKIQALFTEAQLEYGRPIRPKMHPICRNCNICIKNCPGGFIEEYKINCPTIDCGFIVKEIKKEPLILGKIPKKSGYWRGASFVQKIVCRSCQSLCPVNSRHYIRDSLVVALPQGDRGRFNLLIKNQGKNSLIHTSKHNFYKRFSQVSCGEGSIKNHNK